MRRFFGLMGAASDAGNAAITVEDVKHAPCPILVKSLSGCQAACARNSDCRSLVFNRYSQCFLKTTDNDHVVEPTMQHGTIGCVYNRPPPSVDYAQYEKKQASKLDAISDQIRSVGPPL